MVPRSEVVKHPEVRVRVRSGAIASLIVLGVLQAPSAAWADEGHPGEPPNEIPLLRTGPVFGPISIPDVSTTPNGQVGAPAGCGSPEGAAAYKVVLQEQARLDLTVTEQDPDGLCALGLYRAQGLSSIYDVDEREPNTISETMCLGGVCDITHRFGVGTFYVVIWPQGIGPVSRDVSILGELRGFPTITGALTGRAIGSCRRIEKGTTTLLQVDVEPTPPAPFDEVTVTRFDRGTGATTGLGSIELDDDGTGSLRIADVARGYHDIVVRWGGSATRVPRALERCLIVRGPTNVKVQPRGERFGYDDYVVYRDGDRMTFRLPVMPDAPPAKGELDLRIERNIGNHAYVPFEVRRNVEVVDSLAIYRMRAQYRSNGLPFYRMRAEWQGSNTHAPAKSAWICFQINR
jgi:hypothetical protein